MEMFGGDGCTTYMRDEKPSSCNLSVMSINFYDDQVKSDSASVMDATRLRQYCEKTMESSRVREHAELLTLGLH